MKTFLISVESRATGSLQITPSGSGEENEVHQTFLERATAKSRKRRHLVDECGTIPFYLSFVVLLSAKQHQR